MLGTIASEAVTRLRKRHTCLEIPSKLQVENRLPSMQLAINCLIRHKLAAGSNGMEPVSEGP